MCVNDGLLHYNGMNRNDKPYDMDEKELFGTGEEFVRHATWAVRAEAAPRGYPLPTPSQHSLTTPLRKT